MDIQRLARETRYKLNRLWLREPKAPGGNRPGVGRQAATAALIFVAIGTTVGLVLFLPPLLYPAPSIEVLREEGLSGAELFHAQVEAVQLQDDLRGSILQTFGGLALVIGAYGAWKQLRTAHDSQIGDRFSRAVDQIGRGNESPDVAIGGIFSLASIARDSPMDRKPVGDVLAAYVRGHAPSVREAGQFADDHPPRLDVCAPDVQAAITVLSNGLFDDTRLARLYAIRLINLDNVNLGYSNLERAKLRGAWMPSADFRYANLMQADFSYALMQFVNLNNTIANLAKFRHVMLTEADARDSSFYGVNFSGAILERVDFRGTDLSYSNFSAALLRKAKLQGANLKHTNISNANLAGSVADSQTRWPEGFDWSNAGVVLSDSPEAHEE